MIAWSRLSCLCYFYSLNSTTRREYKSDFLFLIFFCRTPPKIIYLISRVCCKSRGGNLLNYPLLHLTFGVKNKSVFASRIDVLTKNLDIQWQEFTVNFVHTYFLRSVVGTEWGDRCCTQWRLGQRLRWRRDERTRPAVGRLGEVCPDIIPGLHSQVEGEGQLRKHGQRRGR